MAEEVAEEISRVRGRSRRTPSHPGKPGLRHTELLSTVHGGSYLTWHRLPTGGQLGSHDQ